jgi:hypothetical protein
VDSQIAAHEVTLPVLVNAVSAEDAAGAGPDAEVTEEVVILNAAKAQDEARRRAIDGDSDGAVRLLRTAGSELKRIASGSERAGELMAQAEELAGFEQQMLASPQDRTLHKQLRYRAREQHQSRRRPPEHA